MASEASKLQQIECDPKCGFKVVSHEEKELVEIGIAHAKKYHNMTVSEAEAKKMITPA